MRDALRRTPVSYRVPELGELEYSPVLSLVPMLRR